MTVPAVGPGNGPDQALPLPSDREYILIEGQQAWFAFQYNGDGSQILITMSATPEDSAKFAVYPPDNTTTPVGWGARQTTTRRKADGTLEEVTLYGGDLVWSGSFRSPGTCLREGRSERPQDQHHPIRGQWQRGVRAADDGQRSAATCKTLSSTTVCREAIAPLAVAPGVALQLPPLKQAVANRQVKLRDLETLIAHVKRSP